MTKRLIQRIASLAPNGIPKYVRCYDNGGVDVEGGSGDRYTVVFSGNFPKGEGINKEYPYLAMSESPFHPQGIGLHGGVGPYNGHNSPCDCIGKDGKYAWAPAIGRKNHLGTRKIGRASCRERV